MDWHEHITVNPAVLHGKACIRGTRIPVAVVLANLADGLSVDEIIRSYPSLTAEGIQAALAYIDVENALRTGELVGRQTDRESRERKYLIQGSSADRTADLVVVVKFGLGNQLVIVTVYANES